MWEPFERLVRCISNQKRLCALSASFSSFWTFWCQKELNKAKKHQFLKRIYRNCKRLVWSVPVSRSFSSLQWRIINHFFYVPVSPKVNKLRTSLSPPHLGTMSFGTYNLLIIITVMTVFGVKENKFFIKSYNMKKVKICVFAIISSSYKIQGSLFQFLYILVV